MEKTRRISAAEVIESRFYQLPKWLIGDEQFKGLNSDAKILYAIMRDRHDLSLKNKWVDDDGDIYMIYTRQSMADDLGVTEKTVTKSVNELKKYNLIDEVRQGCNKPNLLYLLTVSVDSQLTSKKCVSENVNIPYPNKEILPPSDTDINDTDISDTEKEQSIAAAKAEIIDFTSLYYECFNKRINKQIIKVIAEYREKFSYDCIVVAMKRSCARGKDWSYALGILMSWDKDGLYTIEQIEEKDMPKKRVADSVVVEDVATNKNKFTRTYSHNWNQDELEEMGNSDLDRYLEKVMPNKYGDN